jgi:hypothetical protein
MVLERDQRISAGFCPLAYAQENHGVRKTLSFGTRLAVRIGGGNEKLESSN